MKKLLSILLVFVLAVGLLACAPEKVMLQCDGEGCENTVPADAGKDDSWVIFCEECRDNVLDD